MSRFWTVTLRPLLRILTISGVIELRFKRDQSCWKAKTGGYKLYDQEEPSSASKIVKIAHQQTIGLLLSNCYGLVFELLLSALYLEF